MMHTDGHTPTQRSQRGFTLIELMIAVGIVGILAAVAYPIFSDSIRKSRRTDAFGSLSAVQQGEARWRANNSAYADNSQLTLPLVPVNPGDPVGLGLNATTANGYYTVAIDAASNTGFTATATAVAGKSQSLDGNCALLRVRTVGGNTFFGSAPVGGTTFDESTGNPCWSH